MTPQASILLTVIIDYLHTANSANALLSEQLNGNPFELWKHRLVPQKGGGNGLFYFFHGVGCKIETMSEKINFDYCADGSIQTFDEWNIWKTMNQKNPRMSKQEFTDAYTELYKLGLIIDSQTGVGGRVHRLA